MIAAMTFGVQYHYPAMLDNVLYEVFLNFVLNKGFSSSHFSMLSIWNCIYLQRSSESRLLMMLKKMSEKGTQKTSKRIAYWTSWPSGYAWPSAVCGNLVVASKLMWTALFLEHVQLCHREVSCDVWNLCGVRTMPKCEANAEDSPAENAFQDLSMKRCLMLA